MSGSQSNMGGAQPGADPSMEDILASIRRILSEEDLPADPLAAKTPEPPHQEPTPPGDVLILDSSMLISDEPTVNMVPEPPPIVARTPIPPAPPVLMPSAPPSESAPPDDIAPTQPFEASNDTMESSFRLPPSRPEMDPPAVAEVTRVTRPPPIVPPPEMRTEASMAMPEPARPEETQPVFEAIPPPVVPLSMMAASPVLVPVPRPGQSDPTIQLTPPLPSEPVVSTELPRPDAAPVNPPEPLAPIPQPESSPMSASLSSPSGLASSETATAAAGSVTNLVRALTSDRNAQVHSGGPTIADLVREEMRPMLKDWLDSNLPPLVERLVRAEIERVISRAAI